MPGQGAAGPRCNRAAAPAAEAQRGEKAQTGQVEPAAGGKNENSAEDVKEMALMGLLSICD